MANEQGRLQALVEGLVSFELECFVYVPSSHCAPVIRGLLDHDVRGILANREEEAMGIAGGMRLCGTRVAVVMQDNGFGNALTALATFPVAYHVGFPIFANTRGGFGEYNSMINSISTAAPRMLEAVGVAVNVLGPSDPAEVWHASAKAAGELATIQHRPNVTLFHALHPIVHG